MYFGKGYNSRGKYPVQENKVTCEAFKRWKGLLQRCYSKSYSNKGRYEKRGCYVAEEWLDYQNFADWFYKNVKEGWEIDKDLYKSICYSKETCVFLPKEINNLLTEYTEDRDGVTFHKKVGMYQVQLSSSDFPRHKGFFSDIEVAREVYRRERDSLIHYLADKYKNTLPDTTYLKLKEYTTEEI